MLLPRDLIIPALHHATAINNVRSQNLRHTARIYAISIAKRVTENGMNSNTLHLKNHRNFIFALQISHLRQLNKNKVAESLDFTGVMPLFMFKRMLYGNTTLKFF